MDEVDIGNNSEPGKGRNWRRDDAAPDGTDTSGVATLPPPLTSEPEPCTEESWDEEDSNNEENEDEAEESKLDSNGSKTGNSADTWPESWEDEDRNLSDKQVMWQKLEGFTVMMFGVAFPFLCMLWTCLACPKRLTLVILNHPVETLLELTLILLVPFVNWRMWSALSKGYARYTFARGAIMGATIGTSLIVSAISFAGLLFATKDLQEAIGTDFTTGFSIISLLSFCAAASGVFIVNKVRLTRDFRASRARVVAYTIAGVVLSLVAFTISETRGWYIRIAEKMAASSRPQERQSGLELLRKVNPEKELKMECADSRATGLPGLFIPVKSSTQHQLYFALTGKPYRDDNSSDISSMPDDYLSRHVVGPRMEGLSLLRSSLTGVVNSDTLTSTVSWTYVFKNDSALPSEARAEIALPRGAVITGMTEWNNGQATDSAFAATGKAESQYGSSINVTHCSPAMLTELGSGRVLMHCYPVNAGEELKIRATMVIPMKMDSIDSASLVLPRFVATNFDIQGEHSVRLHSEHALKSGVKGLKSVKSPSGQQVLSGTLENEQLKGSEMLLRAARPASLEPVAVLDPLSLQLRKAVKKEVKSQENQQVVVMIDASKGINSQLDNVTRMLAQRKAVEQRAVAARKQKEPKESYIVETIQRVSAPSPKHLVVVVDGSQAVKENINEIKQGLESLPSNVPASLIIASQEKPKLMDAVSLADGLKTLTSVEYVGGQDNLQAVVKAAEVAGETKGGAVLWIHGPQPVLNKEIYIMAPYTAAPSFYELSLGSGETDTYEFFKNHSEIGPFNQVPRNTGTADDLSHFFARWKPGSSDYIVTYQETTEKPNCKILKDRQSLELLALHANEQCANLIANRKVGLAAKLAVSYGLVTPVSCALISENIVNASASNTTTSSDEYNSSSNAQENQSYSGGYLQGATNGTVGPQGADATIVMGVNSAGTVRVNNLANLEALLNILCNGFEVVALILGGFMILNAAVLRAPVSGFMGMPITLTAANRVAIGCGVIVVGLMFPGLVNWFVSSARDANLFS